MLSITSDPLVSPGAAMRLCTEECRVLGHSDQCWMPPLPSPPSDYRSNMFIPGEEFPAQPPPQRPHPGLEDDAQPSDSAEKKKSFSTFGKDSPNEEDAGDKSASSLLSEMSSVFQRLLPASLDSFVEASEGERSNSLERRKGPPPAKANGYPPGVAAWAASTHFQNPAASPAPALGAHPGAQPSCKWLPAMEEIPENYEEDDFDNVLNHLNDGKHELMDASELVAEINKLLQDVRQS